MTVTCQRMIRGPISSHTEDSHMSHQSIKGQKSWEASRIASKGSGRDQRNTNLTRIAEVDTEDSTLAPSPFTYIYPLIFMLVLCHFF
jgi:hypothetical protein